MEYLAKREIKIKQFGQDAERTKGDLIPHFFIFGLLIMLDSGVILLVN